jgi:ferritin-like metal-binding protein YciE
MVSKTPQPKSIYVVLAVCGAPPSGVHSRRHAASAHIERQARGLASRAPGYNVGSSARAIFQNERLDVIKTLSDLFYETLRDMFYAEKKILRTLPKLAKAVNSDDLREAFLHHRYETEGQVERIERVFEIIGKPARGKTCDAIDGILEEGNEVMKDFKGNPALDAGLLAGAQAVEHYEISRYGTLIAWARVMRLSEAPALLQETLEQEVKADELLTKIAKKAVNAAAG